MNIRTNLGMRRTVLLMMRPSRLMVVSFGRRRDCRRGRHWRRWRWRPSGKFLKSRFAPSRKPEFLRTNTLNPVIMPIRLFSLVRVTATRRWRRMKKSLSGRLSERRMRLNLLVFMVPVFLSVIIQITFILLIIRVRSIKPVMPLVI